MENIFYGKIKVKLPFSKSVLHDGGVLEKLETVLVRHLQLESIADTLGISTSSCTTFGIRSGRRKQGYIIPGFVIDPRITDFVRTGVEMNEYRYRIEMNDINPKEPDNIADGGNFSRIEGIDCKIILNGGIINSQAIYLLDKVYSTLLQNYNAALELMNPQAEPLNFEDSLKF